MKTPTVAIDARLISQRNTGDTSYWRGLLRGLANVASDLRILLYSNAPKPANAPETPEFEWIHLPSSHDRLWSLVTFPRAAVQRGADVIHTQYNVSPLCGSRAVTTIHDVSFFIGPEWFGLKDRLLLRWQVPASVKRARQVITVSETSKSELERFIPASRGKVNVTYNALGDNIDPMPAEDARRIVSNELGVVGPYILTVGTRWPRKNIRLAIEACSGLPEAVPHRLVVTGKPGWGDLADHQRTQFTGYVADKQLTALYQCADLYIAPSFHEGFGIPLLEAWACDCPVVCSSGGALPEIAGGAAEVVTSWIAADWTAVIADVLADSSKLEQLCQRGRSRLGEFSWDKTARSTIDVYRKVIG